MTIATNTISMILKKRLTAKSIADATFLLALGIYAGAYIALWFWQTKLGFFEILAVVLYGGMSVVALSVISLIARGIFLYQNPAVRNNLQKVLFFIAAIPPVTVLLDLLGTIQP